MAKYFRDGPNEELYAGPPPLEVMKLTLSHTIRGSRKRVVMSNGISRAYLHALRTSELYVQRCPEDLAHEYPGSVCHGMRPEDTCWRRPRSMYGTRPAARDWQAAVSSALTTFGLSVGKSPPNIYFHRARGIMTFVHGDDFLSSGEDADLMWMRDALTKVSLVKTQLLGPLAHQSREIRFLNRYIRWVRNVSISNEADPKHALDIIETMQVKDLKPLQAPGAKVYTRDGRADGFRESTQAREEDIVKKQVARRLGKEKPPVSTPVPPAQASTYRAVVARGNYIVPDRPDLAFALKGLARKIANPDCGDWESLKTFA